MRFFTASLNQKISCLHQVEGNTTKGKLILLQGMALYKNATISLLLLLSSSLLLLLLLLLSLVVLVVVTIHNLLLIKFEITKPWVNWIRCMQGHMQTEQLRTLHLPPPPPPPLSFPHPPHLSFSHFHSRAAWVRTKREREREREYCHARVKIPTWHNYM